ncbi:hypothetical protein SAMN05216345_1073 [Cupriavidus sp. YR651]|uniref:hypothetical protein n=1 Tax=Cupriavidus sp. YR651 TaxID=1855315 RepID=UPI00088D077F|nr:hypothetical protein [Cupriavidus sp. YR651]SDD22038.1 hypothetical protein SAMN05216345_1073 [Cupriavidus sp. YR651]
MAVDFSLLPSEASAQISAPSRRVWIVAFLVMAMTGMLVVLVAWPQGMPTQTWKFWTTFVVFPLGISAWTVLRRYSVFEGRKLDAELSNEAVKAFNARVFEAASIPLAVLGAAHRFSSNPDENAPERIDKATLSLETRGSIAVVGEPVKARWLVIPGMRTTPGSGEDDRNRRRDVTTWLFGELLDELVPRIQQLPAQVDLVIRLSVSNGLTQQENEALWQDCWYARSLRKAEVMPTAESRFDLISLDKWLDEILANTSLHATLAVAVQLHPLLSGIPPTGSAEAGAALLLVPEELASRYRTPRMASLHRPVRGRLDQPDALSHAVKWGGLAANQIAGGWLTNIDSARAGALQESSRKLGLTVRPADLDQTVGFAGTAAPWLAVACAASSLSSDRAEQVVLVGENSHFDCAVLKRARLEEAPSK